MKLVLPDTVSSLSHDGVEIEIIKGVIDVEGEALHVFQTIHGFEPLADKVKRNTKKKAAAAAAAADLDGEEGEGEGEEPAPTGGDGAPGGNDKQPE